MTRTITYIFKLDNTCMFHHSQSSHRFKHGISGLNPFICMERDFLAHGMNVGSFEMPYPELYDPVTCNFETVDLI